MGDKSNVAPVRTEPTDGAITQFFVDLNADVQSQTSLPPQYHSALRAGFAGYSPNPRWNQAKLKAWRLGRQWRDELAEGKRVVVGAVLFSRDEWETLNTATKLPDAPTIQSGEPEPGGVWRSLLGWSRKKLALG